MKQAMLLTGAGQIGMAIARRMGAGMKVIVGDKNPANARRNLRDTAVPQLPLYPLLLALLYTLRAKSY